MADKCSVPTPRVTSCQSLLWDNPTQSGWLRKRTKLAQGMSSDKLPRIFRIFQKKYIPWLQRYVVLSDGCLYAFSSETSHTPVSAVSLYGFNRVTRSGPEITRTEAMWSFKIVDVHEKKTLWFSASTEKEMMKWMKKINQEMREAHYFLQKEVNDWTDACRTNLDKPRRTTKSGSLPAKSPKPEDDDSDDSDDYNYDFIEKKIYSTKDALKMGKSETNVVEIEETSDQEEAEYAKFNETEDIKLEKERKLKKKKVPTATLR